MKEVKKSEEPKFDLSGGNLCLDFANTVSHRKQPEQKQDNLTGYDDLVLFAREAGVVAPQLAGQLLEVAAMRPQVRAATFKAAIKLREAIYQVFAAVARSRAPRKRDIKLIEEMASQAMTHRRLVPGGGKYRWEWKCDKNESLSYVLWPIAASAAELLTSDRVTQVRECEAKTCAWLFLDQTRNHSRRWCDMSACGNREKARRHYEQKQW